MLPGECRIVQSIRNNTYIGLGLDYTVPVTGHVDLEVHAIKTSSGAADATEKMSVPITDILKFAQVKSSDTGANHTRPFDVQVGTHLGLRILSE